MTHRPRIALTRAVLGFLRDESGPTAVEYAFMLAMIILVCFLAARSLGSRVSASFSTTHSLME